MLVQYIVDMTSIQTCQTDQLLGAVVTCRTPNMLVRHIVDVTIIPTCLEDQPFGAVEDKEAAVERTHHIGDARTVQNHTIDHSLEVDNRMTDINVVIPRVIHM